MKTTGPLFSLSAQGSIAKCATFSIRKSGQQVRFQKKQKDYLNYKRANVRILYQFICACWRSKSQSEKDVFNNLAKEQEKSMTGWNLFLKLATENPLLYLGLQCLLSMNNVVGSSIPDLSKNNNNGLLLPSYATNSPSLVYSDFKKFYKCLLFDGVSQYVRVSQSIPTYKGSFSLMAFVRFSSLKTSDSVFTKHNGSGSPGAGNKGFFNRYITSTSVADFFQYNTSGVYGYISSKSGAIKPDKWCLICFTRDVSGADCTIKLYINGVLQQSKVITNFDDISTQYLTLGRYSYAEGGVLKGNMDNFACFNKALNVTENLNYYKIYAR